MGATGDRARSVEVDVGIVCCISLGFGVEVDTWEVSGRSLSLDDAATGSVDSSGEFCCASSEQHSLQLML